jgi:hypothetical protein
MNDNYIFALCLRSYEISRDHGFIERGKVYPFYRDVNLFLSETAEALEDFRAGRGVGELFYEVTYNDISRGNIEGAVLSKANYEKEKAETLDAFYKAKPCGIPSELADVVIRICCRVGAEGNEVAQDLQDRINKNYNLKLSFEDDCKEDFEKLLFWVEWDLVKAGEFAWFNYQERKMSHLASAVERITRFCSWNGIEIWKAIEEKENYNRTRPFKHGGKKI